MANYVPETNGYVSGPLGAGQIATNQPNVINSLPVTSPLGFGLAVKQAGGVAALATAAADVFGISLKRNYLQSFDTPDVEQWAAGQDVPVIRMGSVAVQISSDVKQGDPATIDANGLFKTATAGDAVIGQFLDDGAFITDGSSVSTAPIQINLGGPTAAGTSTTAGGSTTGTGK